MEWTGRTFVTLGLSTPYYLTGGLVKIVER
jgi:hypothetical protein